jgi:hypothetical protein
MRPMTVVSSLVEANTVCAGCSPYTAGFFVGVELKVADEIAGLVVEVCEVLGRRLLEGNCNLSVRLLCMQTRLLTLLGSPSQH